MESRCTPWGPPPFVPGPEEATCCLGGRGEVYPVPHLQDARGTGKERVKLASGTLFLPPHSKPGELPGPQCGPNLLLWGAAWSGPWGEGGRDSGGSVMMESGKGSPDPQAGVTGLQRGWERRHHEFIGSWDQWNTKPARPQPRRGHRGCPHGPAQGQGPISLPTVIRSWKDSVATHPSKRGASKRGAENGDRGGSLKDWATWRQTSP